MDPAQVQQIILNLVLNARDAMPDGGRVTVYHQKLRRGQEAREMGSCDSWIALAVSDTGCGMDEETRARLFEPFFTTKKPGQGNGLGLATVHRIVTHEGGTIEVESETGRGTRVVVHLPRVEIGIPPSEFRKSRTKLSPVPIRRFAEREELKEEVNPYDQRHCPCF